MTNIKVCTTALSPRATRTMGDGVSLAVIHERSDNQVQDREFEIFFV